MTSNRTDDAVAEYLHELELRLTGLPVLQRRELLAEIEAHISSERVERGVASESDLLELLERLGSPEVVAAAAYEEAGMLQPALSGAGATRAVARPLPPIPPPPDSPPAWAGPFPPAFEAPPPAAGPPPLPRQESGNGLRVVIGVAIAAVVVVLFGCLAGGVMMVSRGASVEAPAVGVVQQTPPEPVGRVEPVVPPTAPVAPTPE